MSAFTHAWQKIEHFYYRHRTLILSLGATTLGIWAGYILFSGSSTPSKQPAGVSLSTKSKSKPNLDTGEDVYYSDVLNLMHQHRITDALINPATSKVDMEAKGHDLPLHADLPPGTSASLANQLSNSGANVAVVQPESPESQKRSFFENIPPLVLVGSKPRDTASIFSSMLLLFLVAMIVNWIVQGYHRSGRAGSGAGMMPSDRANCRAASKVSI
jgi:hypothetical protein